MADGRNGDGVAVLDFEKRYIAGVAEGDQAVRGETGFGERLSGN